MIDSDGWSEEHQVRQDIESSQGYEFYEDSKIRGSDRKPMMGAKRNDTCHKIPRVKRPDRVTIRQGRTSHTGFRALTLWDPVGGRDGNKS